MKDYLISMFIDDELDFDDKVQFVEAVHQNRDFKDETIGFLQQEKVIRSEVVEKTPSIVIPLKQKWHAFVWKPFGFIAAGLAAAMLILFMALSPEETKLASHRFIIFQPDADRIEITGSFTGWKSLPMKPAGDSGYWEITLDLPEGEHRYSYILEGSKRFADPTILTREQDDFGGENSILEVKLQA
jgi:hypothetical protein